MAREAAQESLEEILQRAYFMTVRQDRELVDQDFFSPEFMEHLKKVGIASAFGGGLSGAAMDITTAMNLAPFQVGDQVVLLDGDAPVVYTVTNENQAELRKRQLQQYRHQQRIDLYNEPSAVKPLAILSKVLQTSTAKSRVDMQTRLEALGMLESLIEGAPQHTGRQAYPPRLWQNYWCPQTCRFVWRSVNTNQHAARRPIRWRVQVGNAGCFSLAYPFLHGT